MTGPVPAETPQAPAGASSAWRVALEALDALPEALGARRATLGLSLRAAATQIGTTNATVHRLESGGGANEVTYRLVLAWLDDTEEAPRG